jgi:hypothetical protein
MGFGPLRPVPSSQTARNARKRLKECIQEAAARFCELLESRLLDPALPTSPEELLNLEREVHQQIARDCVDAVIAEVIQTAHDSPEVAGKAEQLLESRPHLRLQDSGQTVGVTLLGGSTVRIHSPYFLERPPKAGRRRKRGRRGKAGNGLYPGLAVLGIHYRLSPALASEVARLTVMSTTQEAVETLELRGIKIDRKKALALTRRLAQRGLEYRKWLQEQGSFDPAGHGSLKGKRLAVGTDGGRVRLRYRNRGRRRKTGHRGFRAEWKEPKVLIVYEIDDAGYKVKKGLLRYDATMGDADAAFGILVAMLKELGAHEAREWVIVGDGAAWIWNRIKGLVNAVGYDMAKVKQVVDWYHALEHLHAIANLRPGMTENVRKTWVRRMKNLLYDGNIDQLVAEINACAKGRNAKDIRKGTTYFETHRLRLQYKDFEANGIPIGSGAVESCVRRTVNLRMKGNGIFWEPSNAEDMLHLRAQFLCGRWHSYIATILQPKEFWTLKTPVQSSTTIRTEITERTLKAA